MMLVYMVYQFCCDGGSVILLRMCEFTQEIVPVLNKVDLPSADPVP